MAQRTDQQRLYELIEQLEANLDELKRTLKTHPHSVAKHPRSRRPRVVRSLYGIFPRDKTTLADFRDARQSWSRRSREF